MKLHELRAAIKEHREVCITETLKLHMDTHDLIANPGRPRQPIDMGQLTRDLLDRADTKLLFQILKQDSAEAKAAPQVERPVEDRALVLLHATLELLKKVNASSGVVDVMSTEVHYDGAWCDGTCLMEDIENYLGNGK